MATLTGSKTALKSTGALKLLAVANHTGTTLTRSEGSNDALSLTIPNTPTPFTGSSSHLMKVLASLSPASNLLGSSDLEASKVDSWVSYATTSLDAPIQALAAAKASNATDALLDAIAKDFSYALSVLTCHVTAADWFVGSQVTCADLAVACSLYDATKVGVFDAKSTNEKLTKLCQWYSSIVSLPCFTLALSQLESTSTSVTLHGMAPPVQNRLYKRNRIRIKELLSPSYLGQTVTVAGWTKTYRKASSKLLFYEINDGSCGTSLQCICDSSSMEEGFEDCKKSGGTGSSFQFEGYLAECKGNQDFELCVVKATLLGAVYGGDAEGKTVGGAKYPMSSKAHSLEHLRENAHLRPRTGLHSAAMRIRHAMAYATHKFFHDHGFLYIHTPIVTCADCEGAGEQFGVTTLLGNDPEKTDVQLTYYQEEEKKEEQPKSKSQLKREAKQKKKNKGKAEEGSHKPEHKKIPGAVDYSKDFFDKRANLTVSGQLNVETHACALSDVYTFGPTFRAENSHTTRHLCEFWMIEPEIAFATLEDDINLAEDYLKYCVQYALEMCADDLEFFENNEHGEKGLRDRLKNVLDNPFKRLTYTEAIEILSHAHENIKEFGEKPEWGIDLPSEMERYLCEEVFKKPVVLTNYPKDIKAFYMKLDDDGKTVSAADILVPKIGEIIGGSQREHRREILVERCLEMNLDPKAVWWYLDLRKYGTVPHAGFGLGFERLILFITGLDNIRDVIPFPRWPGNADF